MTTDGFLGVASTTATQHKYRLAGERLAERWCGVGGMTNAALVCAAFAGKTRAAVYAKSTLRLYREQVLAYVRTLNPDPAQIAAVMHLPLTACDVASRQTAAKKMQHIKEVDAKELCEFLTREKSSLLARVTSDFFEAGLMFGLRPVEWCNAKLQVCDPGWNTDALTSEHDLEPTHRLEVMNAKANEARGNGAVRFIYAVLTVEQAAKVLRVITHAREQSSDWPDAYKALSNALYYAGHALWPRRSRVPCFYTARHQCIANAKAAGGAPNELAAMFGHASDWTARKHYSRKLNGDKNRHIIRASRISLEGVRNQTLTVQSRSAAEFQVQTTKK